jgi:hypothetical protein
MLCLVRNWQTFQRAIVSRAERTAAFRARLTHHPEDGGSKHLRNGRLRCATLQNTVIFADTGVYTGKCGRVIQGRARWKGVLCTAAQHDEREENRKYDKKDRS